MYRNSKKAWKAEEEQLLLESYGSTTMAYMVGRLGRSEAAIRQKYKELMDTKDTYLAGGLLSPRQIAPALGVDHRTVINWIRKHGLTAKRLHQRQGEEKAYRYFIDPYELWRWVKEHKQLINFSRVKRGEILPEPDWLEEDIQNAPFQKRSTCWTREEDEVAFFWWQSGMHYREIAERLGRPEKGTQRRLTVLRKQKGVAHKKTSSL